MLHVALYHGCRIVNPTEFWPAEPRAAAPDEPVAAFLHTEQGVVECYVITVNTQTRRTLIAVCDDELEDEVEVWVDSASVEIVQ